MVLALEIEAYAIGIPLPETQQRNWSTCESLRSLGEDDMPSADSPPHPLSTPQQALLISPRPLTLKQRRRSRPAPVQKFKTSTLQEAFGL
eukprot:scaffold1149_cov236-Pinguiococcus_pyrenoidosus.AAC.14